MSKGNLHGVTTRSVMDPEKTFGTKENLLAKSNADILLMFMLRRSSSGGANKIAFDQDIEFRQAD